MFEGKKYIDVNREERFFCFILGHILLSHGSAREAFGDLLKDKGIKIKTDGLQVFVEAAVLRDYWHALGDPKTKDEKRKKEINEKRKRIVEETLKFRGVNNLTNFVDNSQPKYDFFWTRTKKEQTGEWICYPGRWQITDKLKIGEVDKKELKQIKWAFNAIPDMMIVSNSKALIIEAKLESGEAKRKDGYKQFTTLMKIADLVKHLVQDFSKHEIHCVVISKKGHVPLIG